MTINSSPTNKPGYFKIYIDQVVEKDLATAFVKQSRLISELFPSIDEEKSLYSYALGKWTIKEVMQHLTDAERIFCYRALCFARKETQTLPGFDENEYAANSFANSRTWASLTDELVSVRRATIYMFNSFSEGMLANIGQANTNQLSVNEIGFIIVGHFTHHCNILKERYFID